MEQNNAPKQKIRNPNDDSEAGPSGIAAGDAVSVGASNVVVQTGDIFKLDIDCYEESFDYLPFKDLVNVGKTCKRLQQVAGYCFQQNYSGEAVCHSKGIIFYEFSKIESELLDVEHFAPCIRKITINGHGGLEYFLNTRTKFHRLKEIEVNKLGENGMNRLKDISMPKLEVLRINECKMINNFHEIIESYPKLKRLEIAECTGAYNGFDRKYPTLEYFKIVPTWYDESPDGIPKFLELNPNIRKFTTTMRLLWENWYEIKAADIKLDDLAIEMNNNGEVDMWVDIDYTFNKLHEHGCYKRLHFYDQRSKFDQEKIDQLSVINGLVRLSVWFDETSYTLKCSALKNLEELQMTGDNWSIDVEMFANDPINLKRIHFEIARIDAIMPFIRRSVDMQKIRVDRLRPGAHFNADTNVIDLLALKRERDQLPDAAMITLYVQDKVYLATKWAMKGNDFGLIRLRRIESFDWNHDFQTFFASYVSYLARDL